MSQPAETPEPPDAPADRSSRLLTPERLSALATVAAVAGIVAVVVLANVFGGGGRPPAPVGAAAPSTSASPSAAERTTAAKLASMSAEEIARSALKDRGEVKPVATTAGAGGQRVPSGGKSLANSAEELANAEQSYSFTITTLNILGSQHTAPGGGTRGFAPGRVRTEWAAGLLASYGASIVGLQELQRDQLAAMNRATGGRFDFWPGTSLGGRGIPQNLMWDSGVWTPTYTDVITIPFMGGTRPQPVVRLQHIETGREVYVLNAHNSPKDRYGREDERDKATAIEIAAVRQLRGDGIPVFLIGDFNEHEEIFCKVTSQTDLRAANGGSTGGACRPPRPMRVDWIFGSADVAMTGFRMDTGPAARRITDHAVISTRVSVS